MCLCDQNAYLACMHPFPTPLPAVRSCSYLSLVIICNNAIIILLKPRWHSGWMVLVLTTFHFLNAEQLAEQKTDPEEVACCGVVMACSASAALL